MTKKTRKSFDCVESMRQARDSLSEEIAEMKYSDLIRWLRSHQYSDAFLQRLAERAAQQGDAPDGAARRG